MGGTPSTAKRSSISPIQVWVSGLTKAGSRTSFSEASERCSLDLEEGIPWVAQLLKPFTKRTGLSSRPSPEDRRKLMATVNFDPSTVSKKAKEDLRRTVEMLPNVRGKQVRAICEVTLRSPRNLHSLCTELMKIEAMTEVQAAEVARSLSDEFIASLNRDRRAELGISHAIWIYPNAPCMKDPRSPSDADVQQDSAHRSVNGKRYEISKGLFVNGKWTSPGREDGCKCVSRAVIPELEKLKP